MSFNLKRCVPISDGGYHRLSAVLLLLLVFVLPSPCGQTNCDPKSAVTPIQTLAGVDAQTLREATVLIKEGQSHLTLTRLGYQPEQGPDRKTAIRRWAAWVVLEVADTLGVLPG